MLLFTVIREMEEFVWASEGEMDAIFRSFIRLIN